jgi:putative two-component system response regulator
VYDALTSKRPYKEPWSHKDAVTEIVKGRGIHFDPAVVDAFLADEKSFKNIRNELKIYR